MSKERGRQYCADIKVLADHSSARVFVRAVNAGSEVWLNFHVTVSNFERAQIEPPLDHESSSFKQEVLLHRQGTIANTNPRTSDIDFITEKLREIYGEDAEVCVQGI